MHLYEQLNHIQGIRCTPEESVILSIYREEGGPAKLKELALFLQKEGFDVRPVLPPTVPEGRERLRVIVHAYNTMEEIEGLAKAIAKGI